MQNIANYQYLCTLNQLTKAGMTTTEITLHDEELRQAATEGMDAFINLFTDRYLEAIGGNLTAETMPRLNAEQHTLLAYRILRDEVMEGGFVQLIHNGYGSYIFHNPFARALREWGLKDLSKLIYAARKIYDEHATELEKDRTDDEFMALYEQFEVFDELEETFIEEEEGFTGRIAVYVDEHLNNFAKIV